MRTVPPQLHHNLPATSFLLIAFTFFCFDLISKHPKTFHLISGVKDNKEFE